MKTDRLGETVCQTVRPTKGRQSDRENRQKRGQRETKAQRHISVHLELSVLVCLYVDLKKGVPNLWPRGTRGIFWALGQYEHLDVELK